MARPSLPLGSYGKITFLTEGKAHVARVQFRDFDGVVRTVRRAGKSKAAAERALKAALVDRQAPIAEGLVTRETLLSKAAELWFDEVEKVVDEGQRSPGTLDTYRSIYRQHVKPALGALRVREVARIESPPAHPPGP